MAIEKIIVLKPTIGETVRYICKSCKGIHSYKYHNNSDYQTHVTRDCDKCYSSGFIWDESVCFGLVVTSNMLSINTAMMRVLYLNEDKLFF